MPGRGRGLDRLQVQEVSRNIYVLVGANVRCPLHGEMWVYPSPSYLCGCAMPYREWKYRMETIANRKRKQKKRPKVDRRRTE